MHPEMFVFLFETTLPTSKMYNRNDQSSPSNKAFIVFRSWRPEITTALINQTHIKKLNHSSNSESFNTEAELILQRWRQKADPPRFKVAESLSGRQPAGDGVLASNLYQ